MNEQENTSDLVLVTKTGPVAVVCMNDPRRLNVQSTRLLARLSEVLAALRSDGTVRAVVLKGAGRSFSAGGDLSEYRADFQSGPKVADEMVGHFHACIRTIRDMPQPVIGALQGAIAGGGFSLAIACDVCIAADDASFLSAYTRLGTTPDGGGTWTLTQLLGPRIALELILSNETISAARALEMGLVNKVVPHDVLDSAALEFAQRLAEGPTAAYATAKRLVYAAATSTLDKQLDREKSAFVEASGSADFAEGVSAFFERRPARFAHR